MPALYDVSIPTFIRGLKNLSNMLEKGKAYAAEQGMDLAELLDARLIEDRYSEVCRGPCGSGGKPALGR
jgi:hypothetical protein